jgi:hypothetical protein
MTKSVKPAKNQVEALADFTDHVLNGKASTLHASDSDEELLGLEETALRLNLAFPQQAMDEKTIKRMQADFKMRRQKINASSHPVFWWSQQNRQRLVLAVAIVAIILAVFLILPFFASGSGNTQASAGLHPQNIGLLAFLIGGVVLLAIWLGRRK